MSGFEECFARVTDTDATVCFPQNPGCTYHLLTYERDNASQMSWSGDSGSPVYTLNNDGTANIHGMHVGIAVLSGGGGARWHVHYAEKYSTIQSAFGGSIRNW
ncbi:hypothetical protein [Microtetraspora malaysiensis]|uniref:hypothetical protein n=1 Tax=Microtetraspora malaysiensis TaxID=161358 RepID=UPI003D8BB1F1